MEPGEVRNHRFAIFWRAIRFKGKIFLYQPRTRHESPCLSRCYPPWVYTRRSLRCYHAPARFNAVARYLTRDATNVQLDTETAAPYPPDLRCSGPGIISNVCVPAILIRGDGYTRDRPSCLTPALFLAPCNRNSLNGRVLEGWSNALGLKNTLTPSSCEFQGQSILLYLLFLL